MGWSALDRNMGGGYIVLALEELDLHGRGSLEQIIAPLFGNSCDRQEQNTQEPRVRGLEE